MTDPQNPAQTPEGNIRPFLEWLFDQVFEGSPDGGDIQDKAEELGLLIPVKIPQAEIDANPEKYEKCLEYDTDTLLFPYWSEEVRASRPAPSERKEAEEVAKELAKRCVREILTENDFYQMILEAIRAERRES